MLIEYTLKIALIAIVSILSINSLSNTIYDTFDRLALELDGGTVGGPPTQ